MAISQSHLKSMVQVAQSAIAVLDQTKAQLDNLARSFMHGPAADPSGQFDPSALIFLIGQIERSIQDAIPTSLRIAVALESDHIARTEAINMRRRKTPAGSTPLTRDPSPTPAYRTLSGLRKANGPDFTPVTSIPAPTPQQLADYAAFNSQGRHCEAPSAVVPQSLSSLYNPAPEIPTNGDADELLM